jgi:hypothetical protein
MNYIDLELSKQARAATREESVAHELAALALPAM